MSILKNNEFHRKFTYLYIFSVDSTTPCVKFKLLPLIPASLAGGDHQLKTLPTTGTWRSIPSCQSLSSVSRCKSAVAACMPYTQKTNST